MFDAYYGKIFQHTFRTIVSLGAIPPIAWFIVIGEGECGKLNIYRIQDGKYEQLNKITFLHWLKDGIIKELEP